MTEFEKIMLRDEPPVPGDYVTPHSTVFEFTFGIVYFINRWHAGYEAYELFEAGTSGWTNYRMVTPEFLKEMFKKVGYD